MERLLLVDDDPHILKTISAWLSPRGYDVICAGNAAEGWALAQSAALSCIVLDVDLPD